MSSEQIDAKESSRETEPNSKDQLLNTQIQKSDVEIVQSNFGLLAQFPDEYFLDKHSPSFKCLEQYLCSRSDLRLTLAFFPPLTDPGIDDAFNYIGKLIFK